MQAETLAGGCLTEPPDLDCDLIQQVELLNGMVTLVVIDMQPTFLKACPDSSFVSGVIDQVKLAISRGWAIVLLEVKPWVYGETIDSIMELLERYERFTVLWKEGDDGSQQVMNACRSALNYPDQLFRVTGVFIGACVLRTAWGLAGRNQESCVRVIKEACAATGDPVAAWAAFEQGPRVVVSSHSIDRQLEFA